MFLSLKTYIQSLPEGTLILGASNDELTYYFGEASYDLFMSLGLDLRPLDMEFRSSLAFITQIGNPTAAKYSYKPWFRGPAILSATINDFKGKTTKNQ